ncbi:hypothetical protein TNCV_4377251 [Trichonephila clavipes]|nr:hypothetical protein TNCV_4377251 [Trichonephila clavipes]
MTWPFMTVVDFLHYENPLTWAGIEPAALGADGQRRTNYATHSALAELIISAIFSHRLHHLPPFDVLGSSKSSDLLIDHIFER